LLGIVSLLLVGLLGRLEHFDEDISLVCPKSNGPPRLVLAFRFATA
jgi:hypothetical protein